MIKANIYIRGKQHDVVVSADDLGVNLTIDDVKDLLQGYIIAKTVSILGDKIIDFGNVVYVRISDRVEVQGTVIPRL